ncbi:hypothetical protein BH24ACT1_BH24ACT1_09690 [soil metagenome]
MNSPVLAAALVTPLVGAVAAVLVPTGRGRRSGTSRRRLRKQRPTTDAFTDAPEADADAGDPTPGRGVAVATSTGETESSEAPPDPSTLERAGRISRTLVRVAALAAAALWVFVALLGPSSAGPARAIGPIAPAAAGAALLVAAIGHPARRFPAAGAALALGLATAGLALGAGDGGAGLAVTALAAAAGVIAFSNRKGSDGSLTPGALGLAGTAVLTGGLIRIAAGGGDLNLPTDGSLPLDAGLLLVGGSAVVAVAASLRPRRSIGLLLPIALAFGVPSAAVLGDGGSGVALVLMLLATASALGWALSPRSPRGDLRPLVGALALSSLAAAAVPTSGVPGTSAAIGGMQAAGLSAAWLLAVAAVITAVTLVPVAALCAVPGAAALAVVLIADPEPSHLALGALSIAAIIAGAVGVRRPPPPSYEHGDEPRPKTVLLGPLLAGVPALAAGLWLVVAPESWSWVGEVDLKGWTETLAVGLAGGLIAAMAGLATGRVAVPGMPQLAGPDPVLAVADAPRSARLTLAAGVGLGLALLLLLASSTGAS